eukprot:TRINITY_DN539_c0_g1_i1.p1 TRINITY_DN539_c0_g1~~TRINITY_DN539_c0_g1_i1.p1  ORF type:complete len:1149 (-),score=486.38 TRINITY_DN539_c0_g1_i1:217-3663(-)
MLGQLLKKLVDIIEGVDVYGYLTERYYTQYMALKQFYFEASNIKLVSSTISVPLLPKDPPKFIPNPDAKAKAAAPQSDANLLGGDANWSLSSGQGLQSQNPNQMWGQQSQFDPFNQFNQNQFGSQYPGQIQYDQFGNPIKFDQFGNPIKVDQFGNPIKYDQFGNRIQCDQFGNPVLDQFGNPVKLDQFGNPIQCDQFGNPIKFDQFGNRIQCDQFGNPISQIGGLVSQGQGNLNQAFAQNQNFPGAVMGNKQQGVAQQAQFGVDAYGRTVDWQGRLVDANGRLVDDKGRLVDDKGRLIDQFGRLVDEHGRLINENGYLIDEQGRLVDEQGRFIDAQGRLIDEQGRFIDEQGRLIDEKGRFIDERGRLIDQNGFLIDEQGRFIDDQGRLIDLSGRLIDQHGRFVDEQGRLIDDKGRLIDEQGRLIDVQGRLIDDKGRLVDNRGRLIDESGRLVDEQGRLIDEKGRLIDIYGRLTNAQGKLVDETGRLINESGMFVDDKGRPIDSKGRLIDSQFRLINEHGHLIDEQGRLIDEKGRLVNAKGQLVDNHGRLIDEKGRLIDDKGRLIDERGRLVDERGRLINEQGKLINEHGHLIDEKGRLVNDKGHLIDSKGRLIDDQGRLIDDQGRLVDEKGRLIDDKGRLVDAKGRLIDEQGRLIDAKGRVLSPVIPNFANAQEEEEFMKFTFDTQARLRDLESKLEAMEKTIEKERQGRLQAEKEVLKLQKENGTLKHQITTVITSHQEERRQSTMREIESSETNLESALIQLDNPSNHGDSRAEPEDVLNQIQNISSVVDKIVESCEKKSSEQLLSSIRLFGDSLGRLVNSVKGITRLTENPSLKEQLMDSVRNEGNTIISLLGTIKKDPTDLQTIGAKRQEVKGHAEGLTNAINQLKREQDSVGEAAAQDDSLHLEQLAEMELLNAAKAIEAAAETLKKAKARPRAEALSEEQREQMIVADAIVDAAMAIALATANMVKSATLAQKERVEKGRASGNPSQFYKQDRMWSEGLISASKAVAGATSMLVDVANQACSGKVDDSALKASAKEVAASTAQLVAACRVKSDSNSKALDMLENASRAVNVATGKLVEAATTAGAFESQRAANQVKRPEAYTATSAKILEMEKQTLILRLEKQLQQERQELFRLRKDAYKGI